MAVPLSADQFSVPEYESAHNAYPREVRYKRFDVLLNELQPRLTPLDGLDLDVGGEDALFLSRFFPQEQLGGTSTSFRWSRDLSIVSALGVSPEHRTLTVWMSNGGRPEQAGPARVTVTLDDRPLGEVTVNGSFEPYRFEVPLDLATEIASSQSPGALRLRSEIWIPAEILGGGDVRRLGVMIDRITID